MRRRSWLGLVVLFLVLGQAQLSYALEPLRLQRITPAGDDVPPGRQIVFEFSRPVVPVGRMERRAAEIPITITPHLDCTWRWLNTTALSCQLGEQQALRAATRYTLTVQPGITTTDGVTLAEPITHTFRTERPKVTRLWLQAWQTPGRPELLVRFDQPVTRVSIEQHLYLQTPERRRLPLSARVAPNYPGRGWLIQPVEALPLHTTVLVRVEPGIISTQGPEPGAEQRVVATVETFPPFRFLGVSCTTNDGTAVGIRPGTPRALQPRCNPTQEVALTFSAPVVKETAKTGLQIKPELGGKEVDTDPWEAIYTPSYLRQAHRRGQRYTLPLPLPLQANIAYQLGVADLQDEFGRNLEAAIGMVFLTDHRPASYFFGHPLAVLEQNVDTHIPIVVTNLEAFHLSYETLTTQGRQSSQLHTEPLYNVPDIAYAFPVNVRQLIPGTSGAIQGNLQTTPVVDNIPTSFWAQVTPFHVHVKVGHHNTLVWVTRFDTGLPVSQVQVQLFPGRLDSFSDTPTILATGLTNADGIAVLPGSTTLDPQLERLNHWEQNQPLLFVALRQGNDMGLVPLTTSFWVNASGTNDQYIGEVLRPRYGHVHAWGMTPQGVYRAGDTVDYKLYVRDQDNQRFIAAPRTGYTLKIFDPTDKEVQTVSDLTLSAFGAYDGTFAVPETAAVGWYRFVLSADFSQDTWEPMRVLISDFTPAPFRVSSEVNGTLFAPGDTVQVTTQAKLHAGGPYGTAPTRVSAEVQSQSLVSDDPQAAGFFFAVVEEGTDPEMVYQTQAQLDDQGHLETTFEMPTAAVLYGQLYIESAVQDDRGKSVASHTTARYVGRDRYVGVRQADWLLRADTPALFPALVVNEHGTAVAGTEIQGSFERLQTTAAQVKDAGNAYVTRYTHEWIAVATCTLISAPTPEVCTFTPPAPGTYRFTASIVDTQGRAHSSSVQRWAVGAGNVLWETTPGYALQIFPEKTAYQVGDTARYLIQNPFPGAKALVSIERLGVQRSWVETFPDNTAVIEVPITPDQLPGFYLSVVVMSPRVDLPLGDNQVDLGKPAFRMGYVEVPVRDPYKELRLEVQPRQAVYKPRQTATIDLQVSTRQGDHPAVELAVAVLDEAVFDLIASGRDYFDPYKGFYTLDTLDIRNYNLLLQLIGRQKFDKKGANPGGGGGLDLDLRSLFKFVSYWNPALQPDAEGHATIQVPLPDNLTGWRVLAMAVTAEDRMGLGEGHFKANKPTEIRPALPNQVIAGDRFEAIFTVMNRTDRPRSLEVTLAATGAPQESAPVRQQIEAEPYKRYRVRLPVQTTTAGTLTLEARAGDSQDQDGLRLPLMVRQVRQRQALEVAATYGSTNADTATETIAFPPDMRADVGHLSVVAAPTVIGDLEGTFAYMRDYPYACWEQVLTKGVMAAHYGQLKSYLPTSFVWPESADLPARTLARAADHQAPNGGMAYYIPQQAYVSPVLSAYTALAFNWLRRSAYPIPATVEANLHAYLLTLLRQDVMPDFYSQGMSATVRAMALAALAPHDKISRADMQRYQPYVSEMSLFGQAHYLLALTHIPDTAAWQEEVMTRIRAHGNETGGKLVFSEAIDRAYQRILDSPVRTNCALLSALLAYDAAQPGRDQADTLPFKLVRAITQARQNRQRWENTQENMFCLQALIDFRRLYEPETPQMTLRVMLDNETLGTASFQGATDTAVDVQRPIQPSDPGRTATLTLARQGQGRLYYSTRLFYSPATLKTEPINAGIEVYREYSVERDGIWQLLSDPMEINIGELVKVDLYLSLPAPRNFVVVDDPVPGGLEPVNRDLATASTVDANKARVPYAKNAFWFRYDGWYEFGTERWRFYHQELRHHAVRFYSEYLPVGHYHLAYVAQAIAPGDFTVLPLHVEEMYDPDTFGQSVPGTLRVLPDKTTPATGPEVQR